jgi:heme/copper-type cytochrome/quinol oxidase subunit 2
MKLALINPQPGVHTVDNVATIRGLEWIFQNVVVSILGLAGIVLFIMLLVGGFKYLTSGGNPENAAAAQKVITYAIVGIVLIALSYLILVFISAITGADVTNFSVYRFP